MGYFKALREKWKITDKEQQEMQSLKDFIRRNDRELYFGKYNEVSMESIDEVKKAEKRLFEIRKQVKTRRKNAILGE